MVVTKPSSGSTSNLAEIFSETHSNMGLGEAVVSTGGTNLGVSDLSDTQASPGPARRDSGWRMKRFVAKVGFVAAVATFGLPGIQRPTTVRPIAASAGLPRVSASSVTEGTFQAPGPNGSYNDAVASDIAHPWSWTPIIGILTPTHTTDTWVGVRNEIVFSEETNIHGMDIAGKVSVDLSNNSFLPAAIYPDVLMSEYKTLMREQRIGRLTARQEKRLAEVRYSIQTISHSDEKSQQAARTIREVNLSLADMEERVDARIKERIAEKMNNKSST